MTFAVLASADDRRNSVRDSFAEGSPAQRGTPRRRRSVRRRGIILLMSLSLLTLFLMMLVTLIVITGQYRQSARVQARRDRVGDPPHKIVDSAVRSVLVGTGTGTSSIDAHGLMLDLYGGSWRGVIGVTPQVDASAAASGVFVGLPAGEPLRFNPGSTSSFLTFEFRRPAPAGGYLNLFSETSPGDYTGCILTFVGGSVRQNVSVRILEYVPPTSNSAPDCFVGRFTVARTNPDETDTLPDAATLSSAILSDGQVTFVVNERPFSGYGAGYGAIPDPDPIAPPNGVGLWGYNISTVWQQPHSYGTTTTTGLPAALLPNYQAFDPTLGTMGFGGLNEDYDAVDYQNMFLASVPPRAQRADQIVPSFWRPELINYWRHFTFDHDNDPGTPQVSLWYESDSGTPGPATGARAQNRNDFYRRIIMRPLPTDHPEFTGSNPDFAVPSVAGVTDVRQPLPLLTGSNDNNEDGIPDETAAMALSTWPPMPGTTVTDELSDLNGNGIVDQWDVDNDGDGLTDSIWIDVGLPVQRMEDGKLYKPLVAYLIRDLDGLANVNAHLHSDFADAQQGNVTGPLAGNGGGANRPRGMGYGPAEIAFPSTGFGVAPTYNAPLFSNAQVGSMLAARYGYVGTDERAGRPGVNDLISRLRNPTLPPFYYNAAVTSEWGTPPDAWGTQAIALDYLGQPWNDRIGGTPPQVQTHMSSPPAPFTTVSVPNGPTEGSDDPYEIDLYSTHSGAIDRTLNYQSPDAPYTLTDLERILRWNDADAVYLPSRLAQAVDPAFNDPDAAAALARRRAVTTHSSYIPAAPSAVPSERRISDATVASTAPLLGSPRKWSLYQLFSQKLIANADSTTGAPFNGTNNASPSWDPTNVGHRAWVDNEVRKMMPWESWHGMKMDLNRRWQNGFDDNNNGVVDEPGEVNFPETVFPTLASTANYGLGQLATYNQQFDHLGADPQFNSLGSSNAVARQIYARHLYCTALVLMDYDASDPADPMRGFNPSLMFDDADYATPALTIQQKDELFKRRLAQWAINVVDYRDPDAICTPFEYDVNPYDGWSPTIDGDPNSLDPYPNAASPTLPHQRRIVWGIEAPHLLISETLATHDRRVVDSVHDTSGQSRQTGDTDLDQHRVPQGSLFVELFAVGNRAANDASVPSELYDRTTGELALNRETTGGSPIWRMAISTPHDQSDSTEQLRSAFYRSEQNRVAGGTRFKPTSYDPTDFNLLTLGNPNAAAPDEPVPLERFITFGPTPPPAVAVPGNPMTRDNTFYYRSGTTTLAPGQYAVVAPRALTYMTLMDDDDEATAPTYVTTGPPPVMEVARLQVAGNNFFCYDNLHNSLSNYLHPDANGIAKIVQPKALICAADQPSGWPTPIGANISEPLPSMYYPDVPTDDPTSIGYFDGYAPGNGSADTLIDQPFDGRSGMPLATLGLETTTKQNWRTIYLQRLANPLEDYHPTRNPYLTMDFAPLDISVYNGDDHRPSGWNETMYGQWDPDDDETKVVNTEYAYPNLRFMSRERGESRGRMLDHASYNPAPAGSLSDGHFNLWRHRFVQPDLTEATAAGDPGMSSEVQFRHNLLHTLGYLNVSMGMDSDPALTDYMPPPNAAYAGAPPVDGGVVRSFPWLNWGDRPFASPYELLAIPHSSQTTWFEDWSRDQVAAATPAEPYNGTPGATALANFSGYYKHLWNFFHRPVNPRSPTVAAQSPQMVRLLDYMETPSPFAGSQEFFQVRALDGGLDRAPGFLRAGNSELSRFRDPGRVNLNTMPSVLWDSFNYVHGSTTPNGGDFRPSTNVGPPVTENPGAFAATRRGFDPARPTWDYPTRIAKPYRTAGKADLAPLLSGNVPERLRQFDVGATLLRSDSNDPAKPNGNPEQPLFAGPRHAGDANQFQHTDKNPYFRYEQLTRLPNLTSTQSNVYAVWVTVGYFEAHKTSPVARGIVPASAYAGQSLPDGVWLGQEIGADTGRNRRHRGFYIIDRSIPAAFEPGNDHNSEKTILLRRYLD